jgi:hypothetical protein
MHRSLAKNLVTTLYSVHVVAALGLAPFGVVFEQLDAPALNGRGLVHEGFKEGIRKTRGVKRLLREVDNCLFYFYRVQFAPLLELYLMATSQSAADPAYAGRISRVNRK